MPDPTIRGIDTCNTGCGREPEHRQEIRVPFDGSCPECFAGFQRSVEGREALRFLDDSVRRYLERVEAEREAREASRA